MASAGTQEGQALAGLDEGQYLDLGVEGVAGSARADDEDPFEAKVLECTVH